MMKMKLLICALLIFSLCGCSDDDRNKSNYKDPDWDRLTSADRKRPGDEPRKVESQSIYVEPAAEASDEGMGGERAPALDMGLPEIVGARFEFVVENGETFLEVIPKAGRTDNAALTFDYQWVVNGEVVEFLNSSQLPANTFSKGDQVKVLITPLDGTDTGEVFTTRQFEVPNAPPYFTSQPKGDFEALEYVYQAEAADPNGDPLSFALENAPQGAVVDAVTGLVTWPLTGVTPGIYELAIIAQDNAGGQSVQRFNLNLEARQTEVPVEAAGEGN